ncbi:hypothetical protein EV356DRAFT_496191 [Viridothelium virens]|uniref:Nucleoporin Nup159/Nup146 N-terminal domain-containing protein n=1 Tax=Viridothelium virens TaxID=1048519 RepID=A0A6A6HH25_VIRVR|nr:hypothetical protein EV356DRAFT_496191 [Viridothelium virens]
MNAQMQIGQDLEDIQTEALGFSALSGESKVRLLPSPWPSNALPEPTSSLLSIASGKGLLAAAGPEQLVIASTVSVRQAFNSEEGGKNKSFTPQLSIDVPRLSQVAFSADENFLVISAESGGGFAIYNVSEIMQGNKQPSSQIGTNGISVRALVPNPAADFAYFFSIITTKGQLMLANLNDKQLINGPQGPVIKDGASCVSWSRKGKQLVVGLGNGTAVQMTPDGVVKAEIPRPTNLEGDKHVSTISWLSNDEFLIVYTPTAPAYETAPESIFQLVTRDKESSTYIFQKLLDPSPPFGLNRSPPSHFINRLYGFSDLSDCLIIASTCSPDIGLFTKSEKPLVSEVPAEKITNTYTSTGLALDHRRAQLPYSEDMSDTSPIGVTIDLSSRDMVKRPIPGDELEESTTPLPALMVLNNEGLLSAWWIVYNDSVRQGIAYPGLVTVTSGPQAAIQTAASPAGSTTRSAFGGSMSKPAAPAFGQSSAPSMNKPSPWGTPSKAGFAQTGGAAFGKPAFGQSSFGQPSFGQPAFGQPSQPTSSFGQPSQQKPSFGSPSAMSGASGGSAFGSANNLGNKASPWATSNKSGDSGEKPANPFGGTAAVSFSPFAKLGDNKSAASPFSNISSSSPFTSVGQNQGGFSSANLGNNNNQNKPPGMTPEPSFGSTVDLGSTVSGSSFGQPSTLSSGLSAWSTPSTSSAAFGTQGATQPQTQNQEMQMGDDSATTEKAATSSQSAFGLSSGGFRLDSAFKGDGTAKDDLPKPKDPTAGLFSMGLGDALQEAQKAPTTPIKKEPEEIKVSEISTTPASPPKASEPTKTPAPLVQQEAVADVTDAPLPPDPTSAKFRAKQLEMNANMPPGVGGPKLATAPPKEEPPKAEELPPLAGSPPVDLGEGSSPLSDVPDENLDQMREKPKEAPPDSTPATKPDFSFTPESKPPQESETQKPQQPSNTPFGFPKPPAANFPPPTSRPIASPRSPSPTRNFTTPAAPSGKPLVPPLGGSRPPSRPTSRSERPASRSSFFGVSGARTPQPHAPSHLQQATPKPPSPEPEISDLQDEEDERIRQLLATDIEPTLTLDPFIAHQDYAGLEVKTGLLGQMERTYRDINSMLDTLGLNARALHAWIEGQHQLSQDGGRDLADLDADSNNNSDSAFDDWTLVELTDLRDMEDALGEELEQGRLTSVSEKVSELAELQRESQRLRARARDVRTALDARADPARVAAQRAQPLSAEQGVQQAELRRSFAAFQKGLLETEEGVSVLRAKLAEVEASADADAERGRRGKVPTVEAVRRTIEKMTGMVEKRHNDVTVLEAQMRKVRKGMAGLSLDGGESPRLSQREDESSSPFRTPPNSRGKFAAFAAPPASTSSSALFRTPEMRRSIMPGTYALDYSPSVGSASVHSSPMARRNLGASALGASVRSNGSVATPRKKMSGVLEEDVQRFNQKAEGRKKLLGSLRAAVEKNGVRETKVDG